MSKLLYRKQNAVSKLLQANNIQIAVFVFTNIPLNCSSPSTMHYSIEIEII